MVKVPDSRADKASPTIFARSIRGELLESLSESRAVALLGPRQVGKTTLARDLLPPEFQGRYLTLDDVVTRTAAATDPTGFVADMTPPVVLDEVQRVPELLMALKIRMDRVSTPGQFLLTGSADLLTLPSIRDALPGRIVYTYLWPFSQSEISATQTDIIGPLFDPGASLPVDLTLDRADVASRIAAGGFPEAHAKAARSRQRFFEAYVDSVVGRDVPDLSRLRDPAMVATLLRLLAGRSASLLKRETLARDIGLDRKTVDHHLRILQDLFLIRVHPAWHSNLAHRAIKTPKVYLTDTGLLTALLDADGQRVLDDPSVRGPALETFVVMELVKLASWSARSPRIYHYRDRYDREVDVILERSDGSVVAIEVKSGSSITSGDLRSLTYLRDRLGKRFVRGIVMYLGEQTLPLGDRTWALPVSALWAGNSSGGRPPAGG